MSKIIVLTEEAFARVIAGLRELPHKFSHEVILDISNQMDMLEKDISGYVALVKTHLAPHEAKVPQDTLTEPTP